MNNLPKILGIFAIICGLLAVGMFVTADYYDNKLTPMSAIIAFGKGGLPITIGLIVLSRRKQEAKK